MKSLPNAAPHGPPAEAYERGYARLFKQHVTQAHEGCDFDFLQGNAPTPEPVIF